MADERITLDAFNLLCGKKIGEGIHRDVFECRIRPDLVVKVETATDYRSFANVREELFYSENQYFKKIADWLAPIEFLSPDGRILLMKRCEPVKESDLPAKLPTWITDIKPENFGRLDGRIVLVDYALTNPAPNTRLKGWK